jgi:fido (protein-threonine AMPylation protein)
VLTGDVAAQVEAGTRPPDEIAVDFHYRMVSIHVFPNGNGRRGREAFTWGRADLTDLDETRGAYVAALKAADGFDLEPLVAFAWSYTSPQ